MRIKRRILPPSWDRARGAWDIRVLGSAGGAETARTVYYKDDGPEGALTRDNLKAVAARLMAAKPDPETPSEDEILTAELKAMARVAPAKPDIRLAEIEKKRPDGTTVVDPETKKPVMVPDDAIADIDAPE